MNGTCKKIESNVMSLTLLIPFVQCNALEIITLVGMEYNIRILLSLQQTFILYDL